MVNILPNRPSVELLRRMVARSGQAGAYSSIGHAGIDRALGGGLARGRLHEMFTSDVADAASAAGFATMIGCRLGGHIVWLREEQAERQGGAVFAPGLRDIGIDPARLVLGVLPDPLAVLRAAADVARCSGVGVAVIELWRNPGFLDLTASRRLALAAEKSGVTLLLLRVAAKPLPSAAQTRWKVQSAPSLPLEANATGHPALEVELLRQRGRPPAGPWQLEWSRDEASFRNRDDRRATLSGTMVPLPAGGSGDAGSGVPLRRAAAG